MTQAPRANQIFQEDVYVADLFCGAGGSSTGAEIAIEEIGGHMVLKAVNHWNRAIETHQANHPTATHVLEDVSVVDPESVVEEGYLDLLLASPECKFHSRARGGKPINDQGRMSAWAIFNWLTKLDVRCVIVENVPEFTDWGPEKDGKPDRARRGEYFQAWFLSFQNLGYDVQWRMLNAADYGEATTRTRFFLQARKDGRPLVWPEPTHAKSDTKMFPGLKPWRGAREIIDWNNPGRSLLDDPKYRKKPLSEKTMHRIARGLLRHGGILAPLYIRLLDLPQQPEKPKNKHTDPANPFLLNRHGENGSLRVHSVEEPMPTATTRGAGYLVSPDAEPFHASDRQHTAPRKMDQPLLTITTLTGGGQYVVRPQAKPFVNANRNHNAPKALEEPVPTVTTAHGGGSFLVEPSLKSFVLGQQSGGAPRSPEEPIPTITADGAISLVQPSIIEYYGQSHAREVESPLAGITAKARKHALIQPILVEYYTNSEAASIDNPVPTITTKDRHALLNPSLVEVNHGDSKKWNTDRVQSVEDPLGAITTKRGVSLVNPLLIQTGQTGGNGGYARPADKPVPTITTRNDVHILTPQAAPYIVANFGEREGQPPRVHDIDEPLPTVSSRGAGSLVSPTLSKTILEQAEKASLDPRRIVFINGQPFILDIRFRMLQNSELAKAMGFSDEETEYEFAGNVSEITKQIGNAVPVHLAAALVKAALGPTPPVKAPPEPKD